MFVHLNMDYTGDKNDGDNTEHGNDADDHISSPHFKSSLFCLPLGFRKHFVIIIAFVVKWKSDYCLK